MEMTKILYRAMYQTMRMIEQEEEYSDDISKATIERLNKEVNEIRLMILAEESK